MLFLGFSLKNEHNARMLLKKLDKLSVLLNYTYMVKHACQMKGQLITLLLIFIHRIHRNQLLN